MLGTVISEFRKLLSVRSTYIISAIGIALGMLYAFLVDGLNGGATALQADKFQIMLLSVGGLVGIFAALVGILLVAHEYRYNTIMYALTNTNSRSKFIIAKIIAITTYTILFTIAVLVMSTIAMYIGLSIKDFTMVPQDVAWWSVIWRCMAINIGFGLIGITFGLLFRNMVGAIIAVFVIPTVEPMLGIWLKDNAKYLPFTSSDQIITGAKLSSVEALGVFGLWLALGLLVSWLLFYRRDAN